MQRYVSQLLTDLETATRNAPASSTYRFRHPFDNDDERDAPAYQLRYLHLNELFGLPSGIFPPSERLTKEQLTALLTAIENLWRAWTVSWDCPPRLTARRRYTVMVEILEQDSIPYNYESGAAINFCSRRSEKSCPFGDSGQCWCDELDACVQHDMDTWENGLEFQEFAPRTNSPLEELREWLDTDKPELSPWEMDEQADQWGELMADEESLTWLFFYDQHRNQDPDEATEEQISPEDYEDFDWHNEEDEFGDLPF